jgi:hypothetical protein
MNLRKHLERQIARWIEGASRAAAEEGLRTTTDRALGEIRVEIRHPDGPVALVATFTSPPALTRRTTPEGATQQVTLDEVIARKAQTAAQSSEAPAAPQQPEASAPEERQQPEASAPPEAEPGDVVLFIMQKEWEHLDAHDRDALRALTYPTPDVHVPNTRAGSALHRVLGPMSARVATHLLGVAAKHGIEIYTQAQVPSPGSNWRATRDPMDASASSARACLAVRDRNAVSVKRREKGSTEAQWLQSARETTERPDVRVARLYSSAGACLWDSRDGGPMTTGPSKTKPSRASLVTDHAAAPAEPAPEAHPRPEGPVADEDEDPLAVSRVGNDGAHLCGACRHPEERCECDAGADYPEAPIVPETPAAPPRASDAAPPEAQTEAAPVARRWLHGFGIGTLADLSDDGVTELEAAGLPDLVLASPRHASGQRYRGWWFARPVENTDALYTWAAAWKVSLLSTDVDGAQLAAHVAAASVAPALPARLARAQDVNEQAAKFIERNERKIKADAKTARAAKKAAATNTAPKNETTRAAKKAAKKLPKGTRGAK